MVVKFYYPSPLGLLEIHFNKKGIFRSKFLSKEFELTEYNNYLYLKDKKLKLIYELIYNQLNEYFTGEREIFEIPIVLQGTEFEKKVWKRLLKIPYGETNSYKDIAFDIGHKKAARAVGNANRNNPLPIIIPCHRVIHANGNFAGYAGGTWRKEWLLAHEKMREKQIYCNQNILQKLAFEK